MGMENVWGLAGQRMMMSPANHARSASIAQVMMSPAFETAGTGAVPGGGKRKRAVFSGRSGTRCLINGLDGKMEG